MQVSAFSLEWHQGHRHPSSPSALRVSAFPIANGYCSRSVTIGLSESFSACP